MTNICPNFRRFVQDIESSASSVLGDDLGGRQLISAISWDGELRLTLFERDTLLFDLQGNVLTDGLRESEGVCACLVQVIGIWMSARSWGIKFAMKEMKELDASKAPKPINAWAFREDVAVVAPPPSFSDWLFREDD